MTVQHCCWHSRTRPGSSTRACSNGTVRRRSSTLAVLAAIASSTTAISGTPSNLLIACLLQALENRIGLGL